MVGRGYLDLIPEEQIGQRIRKLRLDRGLTVTVLARQAGISQGYLSKIENSKKAPPVSTMVNLARALGVGITDILSPTAPKASIAITRKSDWPAITRQGLEFGYSFVPLALQLTHRHMEPYILHATGSGEETESFRHPGEEMMLVLKGSLLLKYGEAEYILEEGDFVYFDSGVPHSARVIGPDPVRVMAVGYIGE